jgi:hypothetical protein
VHFSATGLEPESRPGFRSTATRFSIYYSRAQDADQFSGSTPVVATSDSHSLFRFVLILMPDTVVRLGACVRPTDPIDPRVKFPDFIFPQLVSVFAFTGGFFLRDGLLTGHIILVPLDFSARGFLCPSQSSIRRVYSVPVQRPASYPAWSDPSVVCACPGAIFASTGAGSVLAQAPCC